MDSIILPENFQVDQITYGTPRTNDNGGKSIYLSLHKKPIVLQTPEMFAPFGMQKWDNEKGITKYTLDLSFKGMDTRETVKTFFEKITELDDKLIDDGVTNSFDWLKKKGVSRDVVKELYTRMVRFPIDKTTGEISTKYPPTFKLTLPFRDGGFQCEVYDASRKQVELSSIETKSARVTAIIQCLGVWVAAGKFGCTWKVLQMRIAPPQAIKGYAFKEVREALDDIDEDDVASTSSAAPTAAKKASKASSEISSSEDDEDDEEDELEAPAAKSSRGKINKK
jgi:hypothetical protein